MTKDSFNAVRALFRTVGPQAELEYVAMSNCTRCDPHHTTGYACKKCGYQVLQRWRMVVHLMVNARNCDEEATRRELEWAAS